MAKKFTEGAQNDPQVAAGRFPMFPRTMTDGKLVDYGSRTRGQCENLRIDERAGAVQVETLHDFTAHEFERAVRVADIHAEKVVHQPSPSVGI